MDTAKGVESPTTRPPMVEPRRRRRPPRRPTLRFTPWAWAKLVFLRDLGPTEVGGFGISAADDLLLIEDIRLVRQRCTSVTVQFDDAAVADFFDEMVDRGLPPERFARVWIHTHPGDSASPSWVDEETFVRSFGRSDWALMFILAQGGQTTARLRFHVGPGGDCELPVDVDFSCDFAAPDRADWKAEYQRSVLRPPPRLPIVDAPRSETTPSLLADDALTLDVFEQRLRDGDYDLGLLDEEWEFDSPFAEEVVYG